MTHYFIGATLVIGLIYGSIEVWPLLAGPHISLSSPHAEMVGASDGIVTIAGTVQRVARLRLNGTEIVRDQDGRFSSTLTFPQGGSILTLEAVDRFGRHVTLTRSLFVP